MCLAAPQLAAFPIQWMRHASFLSHIGAQTLTCSFMQALAVHSSALLLTSLAPHQQTLCASAKPRASTLIETHPAKYERLAGGEVMQCSSSAATARPESAEVEKAHLGCTGS